MTASFAVENAAGYSSDGSTFAKGTNPITEKALLLRNLVQAAEFLHSHIIHFYTLAALDYVLGPPISPWIPYFGDTPSGLTDWENALTQIAYGTTGGGDSDYQTYFSYYSPYLKPGCISAHGYDPYGINNILGATGSYPNAVAELNDQKTVWARVIAEYVEALHWKRKCFELASLFSGPQPMWRNLVMGGVALDATESELLNLIDQYEKILYKGASGTGTVNSPQPDTLAHFVYNKYYPLTQILPILYPAYTNSNEKDNNNVLLGGDDIGQGHRHFLSYGVFNSHTALPGNAEGTMVTSIGNGSSASTVSVNITGAKRLHKRGWYMHLDTPQWHINLGTVNLNSVSDIEERLHEYIETSWYNYTSGDEKNPFEGETDPNPTKSGAYTWSKAPRLRHTAAGPITRDFPMEVGALARMWVSGLYYDNGTTYTEYSNDWKHAGLGGVSSSDIYEIVTDVLNGPPSGNGVRKDLYQCGASVMDRHRARALEEICLIKMAAGMLTALASVASQASYTARPLPSSNKGFGLNEAPRGALAHFIDVDSAGRLDRHQAIVPSTWNDSPTVDSLNFTDGRGAIEEAIMTPTLTLSNVNSLDAEGNPKFVPLEVLRVIRSFDPCLACTVHAVEKKERR